MSLWTAVNVEFECLYCGKNVIENHLLFIPGLPQTRCMLCHARLLTAVACLTLAACLLFCYTQSLWVWGLATLLVVAAIFFYLRTTKRPNK